MGYSEKRFILLEFSYMEKARVTGDVERLKMAIDRLREADLSFEAKESAESLMENMTDLLNELEGGTHASN